MEKDEGTEIRMQTSRAVVTAKNCQSWQEMTDEKAVNTSRTGKENWKSVTDWPDTEIRQNS